MAQTLDSSFESHAHLPSVTDGLRAAMYGEMAAAAGEKRPWCERETVWDTAMEGAIQFLIACRIDDRLALQLLDEATATRLAGDLHHREMSVRALCERLAAEFRRRVQNTS